MYFQDSDITLCWEEILGKDEYHLKLLEIQDNYPDKKSLFVSYPDIDVYNSDMASFILESPDKAIKLGESVIKTMLPVDWDPSRSVNLRITDLPKDAKIDIREIRAKHLGRLVAIEGMVRKVTAPRPRLTNALYRCSKCDAELWMPQSGTFQKEPLLCVNDGCNKTAPRFSLDEKRSVYIDTQKVEIQENPEGLRGGAQPERLFGAIEDDISGAVTAGDRIILNGILRSVQKKETDKSTIFDIYMDVLSVESEQSDFSELEITEEDEKEILRMSKDPELLNKIVKSISPTIFGLDKEKEAVALQLFGGSHKQMDDGTSIRGDIHILMIGDPGVAKSQLLRYMSSLSPRGIYASGKSASAAGLCVHGDTILQLDNNTDERIEDFVLSRMTDPEEYRPGIWRQKVMDEIRIESPGDFGSLRVVPITYVWKIKTPEMLYKITTMGKDTLILTAETKLQAMQGPKFDWIEAKDLRAGDFVTIVHDNIRMMMIESIEVLTEDLPEFVYDLTVEPSHAFLGSGFIIHNTAAAIKDESFGSGGYILEAGALVLADKGLACIDELDKMSNQDRSSLHEAMESQKISVAKAGITATLQCRCSMLAAANPKYGRFDEAEKIAMQIDLPPALMSRFDLMFILTDKPDHVRDKNITKHILKAHLRGQARAQKKDAIIDGIDTERILRETDDITPPYGTDIMRKYVAYAKKTCFPVMTDEAMDIIMDDYLNIRKQGDDTGSIPITARQLEAYVRLSEASAKMHLRSTVAAEDAQRAVNLINYYLGKIAKSAGGYDIDLAGGPLTNKDRKGREPVRAIIERFTPQGGITYEELVNLAAAEGIDESGVRIAVNMLKDMTEIIENKGKFRTV